MMPATTSTAQNPNPTTCQSCSSNPWKYRCPACSFLSCSLPCVQSHKKLSGCTGKRSRTDFVPLANFDDNLLLSDYGFLEDAKRAADSARRIISKFGSTVRFPLPWYLKKLVSEVKLRRSRVFFLPKGMERREKNKTNFCPKDRCIYWTVEWKFHMAGVSLIDHGVGEHLCLSSAIEKHLEPSPWNSQLRPYSNVNLDDLKFFIKQNAMRTKSAYHQLNARATIRSQLENSVILEYPVIHVYLPSESYDFQVTREKKPYTRYKEPSESVDVDSNRYIKQFREEEIEEGEVPFESQVVDLLHHRASDKGGSSQFSRDDVKKEDCYQDRQIQVATSKDDPPFVSKHQCTMEEHNICLSTVSQKLLEDENFDFEQEVKDAYSDFIGEVDPDEFLCFDGGYNENDFEGEFPSNFFEDLPTVDELEEGEIPN